MLLSYSQRVDVLFIAYSFFKILLRAYDMCLSQSSDVRVSRDKITVESFRECTDMS